MKLYISSMYLGIDTKMLTDWIKDHGNKILLICNARDHKEDRNSEELWNKRMDNLTKVPKFRPGDRIVMYGFEGVPLTIQRIEGDKYICADDYGREVPIQISVQGSFTTI